MPGLASESPAAGRGAGVELLHVVVLGGLVVATPLCELLRRFPEFLWAHSVTPAALGVLVAGLLVLVPLPLLSVVWLLRTARTVPVLASLLGIGLPTGALVLQLSVRFEFGGWWVLLTATALGIVSSLAYQRWRGLRRYLAMLLLVTVLAPGRLLYATLATDTLGDGAQSVELGRTGSRAPVVFVIFDELPMISLLAGAERWDERNFPNFARLAATAHSFTNVRSVDTGTLAAVPAILTTSKPEARQAPTLANFPRNLFTLLGGDHRLWAVEPATALCPVELNSWHGADKDLHWPALTADLWVLWKSVTVPAPWAEALPEAGSAWRDFTLHRKDGASVESSSQDEFADHYDRMRSDIKATRTRRGDVFRRFVATLATLGGSAAEPELHFVHTMLPHGPWIYLPSGASYFGSGSIRVGGRGKVWRDDPQIVALAYQRHLLQARFADRLLGELLDRLQSTARFDRSLIVVTADHGASFRPGQPPRDATGVNPAETLWVPLLIKEPGQSSGVIHRRAIETTVILPTVIDLLGIDAPWPLNVASALDLADAGTGRRELPEGATVAMAWKKKVFGVDLDLDPPLRMNRHADLIGERLEALPPAEKARLRLLKLEPGAVLDNRPQSGTRPVWITGILTGRDRPDDCCDLAFAVNGRIAAVQRSYASTSANFERFQTLLPESSLVAGANDLQVLVIAESAGGRRLLVPRWRDERGQLEYASEALAAQAHRIIVHGTIGDATPGASIDLVLPSSRVGYRVVDGKLVITDA